MRHVVLVEFEEITSRSEEGWWPKRQSRLEGFAFQPGKQTKIHGTGLVQCSQCGGEVKILVSPKRNPHSNKLGRAVTMKDHDLCRRCWRQLVLQFRQEPLVLAQSA